MQQRQILLIAFATVLVARGAIAQQARDDGGLIRLQGMVQQLTADRTKLQADNTKLKSDLDAANAELKKQREANAGLERRVTQGESSLSQASAANSRNEAALAQQRSRMDELVAQFRMTIDTLRTTELERNDLKTKLESKQHAFEQCVASNRKLFETGNDVLDKFEDRGRWAALRVREPFTQVKRVELQNLVDEYRWALEDQRLPENSDASSVAVPEKSASDHGS